MQSQDDERKEQLTRSQDAKGDLTVKEVIQLYDDARKYADTGHRVNWDNYFKVYKGKRVFRNYEGVSDPVIRESHTIIETLVANIAGGDTTFSFFSTNEEQSRDTEVLNNMIGFFMAGNQMKLKTQEWVRDMLLYGTGILHVTWEYGRPCIENIPLRDFFVDPTSTGMVQTTNPAEYAGYEYLANKESLKRMEIFDPEAEANPDDKEYEGETPPPGKGAWVPRYKNLDNLGPKPSADGDGDTKGGDKAFKDMFVGSTLGDTASKDQIHVIRMYHLPTGRIFEIGNKKEFIYNEATWCQREEVTREAFVTDPETQRDEIIKQTLDEIEPFLPFAVLRDYIDTSQFYAEGEMALLINDAELLNDLEAMDIDNNAYQNTPMYWIDPQFADLAPEIETIPGAVYPIPRNAMGALERPQLSGDLDNKKERIMQRMRRATAADESVQGGSTGNSRTTATEVSTQLAQAQMRFSTKIANLEDEGLAQLASILFKMVQIFITKKTAVRIVGKMGVVFKDFDPWEYNGQYEAHAKLSSTINREKQEVGMKMNQVFQLFTGDAAFNQVEVKRWMAQFIDPDLTDEKFNSMLAPAVPPKETAFDTVSIAYKDLEPWGRYQAQLKAGWDPDPSLAADMQNRMVKQAVEGVDDLDPATRLDGTIVPGLENDINPPVPTPAKKPAAMAA